MMPEDELVESTTVTRESILRGTLMALTCAVTGGTLIAMGGKTSSLGVTMFLLLPSATGFVTVFSSNHFSCEWGCPFRRLAR